VQCGSAWRPNDRFSAGLPIKRVPIMLRADGLIAPWENFIFALIIDCLSAFIDCGHRFATLIEGTASNYAVNYFTIAPPHSRCCALSNL
jgi:hypothetical protein